MKFNSFKDISIKNFYELQEILNTPMSDDDKNVYLVSFFTGESEEDVLAMTHDEFADYIFDINQIFLDEQKTRHYFPKKKITIGDVTYDILQNVEKMSVAQYIDLQTFGGLEKENIGKILSIFLIPEKHKYNTDYSLEETIENIENNLSIIDAKSMTDFFFKKFMSSINHTTIFFKLMMKMMTLKTKIQVFLNKIRMKVGL